MDLFESTPDDIEESSEQYAKDEAQTALDINKEIDVALALESLRQSIVGLGVSRLDYSEAISLGVESLSNYPENYFSEEKSTMGSKLVHESLLQSIKNAITRIINFIKERFARLKAWLGKEIDNKKNGEDRISRIIKVQTKISIRVQGLRELIQELPGGNTVGNRAAMIKLQNEKIKEFTESYAEINSVLFYSFFVNNYFEQDLKQALVCFNTVYSDLEKDVANISKLRPHLAEVDAWKSVGELTNSNTSARLVERNNLGKYEQDGSALAVLKGFNAFFTEGDNVKSKTPPLMHNVLVNVVESLKIENIYKDADINYFNTVTKSISDEIKELERLQGTDEVDPSNNRLLLDYLAKFNDRLVALTNFITAVQTTQRKLEAYCDLINTNEGRLIREITNVVQRAESVSLQELAISLRRSI